MMDLLIVMDTILLWKIFIKKRMKFVMDLIMAMMLINFFFIFKKIEKILRFFKMMMLWMDHYTKEKRDHICQCGHFHIELISNIMFNILEIYLIYFSFVTEEDDLFRYQNRYDNIHYK